MEKHDEMTEDQRAAADKAAREKEAAEQAALPYRWRQTLGDVDVSVPVTAPGGGAVRGRDLVVDISRTRLRVALRSDPGAPLIDGELCAPIKVEDSTWLLDKGEVQIHLEKCNGMEWWKNVIQGHPAIDTTKIDPGNSKLSDLDGATRAMVEKMMFDQQQKALGRPTSDERQKAAMLDKFKQAHPELDFSNAKVSY